MRVTHHCERTKGGRKHGTDCNGEKGTQEAAAVYYEHILLYPYQMYIHWSPSDQGNILFNDKRFVSLLYRWHNDEFTEYNKVSDAGSYI